MGLHVKENYEDFKYDSFFKALKFISPQKQQRFFPSEN